MFKVSDDPQATSSDDVNSGTEGFRRDAGNTSGEVALKEAQRGSHKIENKSCQGLITQTLTSTVKRLLTSDMSRISSSAVKPKKKISNSKIKKECSQYV